MPSYSQQPAPAVQRPASQLPAPTTAGPSNSDRAAAVTGRLSHTLRRGDHGEEVKILQQFLKVADDGDFGGGTERAL